MEKKSEDILKKVTNLIEESKRKKITDFDSGLLQESFEPVIGTTEEKYDLWCKRLLNVATRLENLRIKNKKSVDDPDYSILKEINAILSQKPPKIQIMRESQGDIDIMCNFDVVNSSTCSVETFDKTLEVVKAEEYYVVINRIKKAEYMARARLDSVKWHKDDAIGDVGSKRM